jgi:hypothetical protein
MDALRIRGQCTGRMQNDVCRMQVSTVSEIATADGARLGLCT